MGKTPKRLKIVKTSRPDQEGQVRLHLEFHGTSQPPVEIALGADDLMGLMMAMQGFQARHRIPIPPSLRPKGKPSLTIVADEQPS